MIRINSWSATSASVKKNKDKKRRNLDLGRAMVIVVKNQLIGIKHSDDLYIMGFQERDVDRNRIFSDVSNHQKWQRWLCCGGMMQLCKAGVYCKPSRRIRKLWICGVDGNHVVWCPTSFELLSGWGFVIFELNLLYNCTIAQHRWTLEANALKAPKRDPSPPERQIHSGGTNWLLYNGTYFVIDRQYTTYRGGNCRLSVDCK